MSAQIKDTLTLDDVFEIRRQLDIRKKSESKLSVGHLKVFREIVYGSYDKYKGEMLEIINEDIAFLNKDANDLF